MYNAKMPSKPRQFTIRFLLLLTGLFALSLAMMRLALTQQDYPAGILLIVSMALFSAIPGSFVGFILGEGPYREATAFVIVFALSIVYLVVSIVAFSLTG